MTSYSTRSWVGVGVMALIAVPRLIQLALDPSSLQPIDFLALVGSLYGAGLFFTSHVVVNAEGIERRPGTLRIPWAEIVELHALPRDDRVLRIRIVRRNGRRTMLTPMWVPHERGRALLEGLREGLASR